MSTNDHERGVRLREAMALRGRRKMMALATELGVSPAALSKWKGGAPMSVEHACRIAEMLDVSLDWLLIGRGTPDWPQRAQFSESERRLLELLRDRPDHFLAALIQFLSVIPESGV